MIRNILFKDLEKQKFMIGERLVFNHFYKIKSDGEDKSFYSSMPFIVKGIRINHHHICEKFDYDSVKSMIDENQDRSKYDLAL